MKKLFFLSLALLINISCFAGSGRINVTNETSSIIPKVTVNIYGEQGLIASSIFQNVKIVKDEIKDTYSADTPKLLDIKFSDIKYVEIILEDDTLEKEKFPILLQYFKRNSDLQAHIPNQIIQKIIQISTYEQQIIENIKYQRFNFGLFSNGDTCTLSISITNHNIFANFTEIRPK
ncbi:MAG: hypothetical protein HRT87_12020 [Legionellales bacterium]|nr:hypothetical protein [Legionellales bacterium]